MSWVSQNIAQVFQFLPGFITAAIFYALTAHPKTTEFERVIQALIFTLILKVLLFPIRSSLFFFGSHVFSLGQWTQDTELAGMVIFAIPLGLLFSYLAHTDAGHAWARAIGLTSRTSFPSEWFGAFTRSGQSRWVILHIKGSRRLYGWPEEWPDQPDKGHFVIQQPEWVLEDSTRIPIYQANRFLIPATEVEFVEFLAHQHELILSEEEIKAAQAPLIELHRSQSDGSKTTESCPKPAIHSTDDVAHGSEYQRGSFRESRLQSPGAVKCGQAASITGSSAEEIISGL